MNVDFPKYKHLSFDLWLTLIKSNPEFKKQRVRLFKNFFGISKDIDEVFDAVRYYDVLCNKINEINGRNINTFDIYFLILQRLGVDINSVNTIMLEEFYGENEKIFMMYRPFLMHENIAEFFRHVESYGLSMSLISNTGFIKGKTMRALIKSFDIDIFFCCQTYSDEVGYSKPNAKIYQAAYDQIVKTKHIEKENILHIGDNYDADFLGAQNFGFKAHLII